MLRKVILTACLTLTAACTAPSGAMSLVDGLVVRAGTSFGMCLGYCTTELTVTPEEILFVERSRNPAEHPERTRRAALGAGEWEEIVSLAGRAPLEGLQEVYGCPDCADGGADWIEVERDGVRRRVTFEHGSTVERIQPLIEKARELRERFPR